MKRLGSSDSLGALMSICPTTTEHSPANNHVFEREIQSMLEGLDEEGCVEQSGHVAEKKRRLSVDQVKALEKNFEVENKLEPERKVNLAQMLGLQPRLPTAWLTNRRSRRKTKQRVRLKSWWGPRQSGGRRRQRVAAHEAVKLLSGAATATA